MVLSYIIIIIHRTMYSIMHYIHRTMCKLPYIMHRIMYTRHKLCIIIMYTCHTLYHRTMEPYIMPLIMNTTHYALLPPPQQWQVRLIVTWISGTITPSHYHREKKAVTRLPYSEAVEKQRVWWSEQPTEPAIEVIEWECGNGQLQSEESFWSGQRKSRVGEREER